MSPHIPGERDDILSLDVYSNDRERYLLLNGSRDHTVTSKISIFFLQKKFVGFLLLLSENF